MAGTLQLSILTPERTVFEGVVEYVDAPGGEGCFGVLASHAGKGDHMPLPLHRFVLFTFCLLPALGVGVPTRHANVVATFLYSCDASNPDPRVRTTYTAAGRPRPRFKSSPVEVFQRGQLPMRKYVPIGEVSVLASGSRMSVAELTDWAQRGARRLGGDAIVNVSWDDAASVQPKVGPVGLLYLTASVVRWE